MTPIVCQTNLAQTILVTRGFYYCARMISEQYGTVFTGEHYEKFQKVYSIWICPDPAKKRRNGIFRYHTVQDPVWEKPGRLQTITILWKLDTKSRIHRYNLVVFFAFEVFCGEKIHLFKLLQRT